ncbi:MAG: alpha-L-rhamnosidase N-terminal domain-containing protein [Phocaeicola sp.]
MNIRKLREGFLICLLMISISSCRTNSVDSSERLMNSAIWIEEGDNNKQQYAIFRKQFSLEKLDDVINIQLFADSRYLLWVNGTYVMRGPCRFHPSRPEYDTKNIASLLVEGENSIAVLVHHYGSLISSKIMKGEPAFTLRVTDATERKEYVATDETWRYTTTLSYLPAKRSSNSMIDHIDGRIDQKEWSMVGFDDATWSAAKRVDTNKLGTFYPNEMPLPEEQELAFLRHLPSGVVLDSILPITLKQGEDLVIDYGKMGLIYPRLELDAISNSRIRFNFALRYKDGQAREVFGESCTYTTCSGEQEVMLSDQWVSHYMVLKCDTGEVTINKVIAVERSFPFERMGSFLSNDTLLNDLWEMSVNTIKATSDDAYASDARERNQWIQDGAKASFPCSRVALASPTGSGKSEMSLLKNIIRHAALSQLPDGRFRATYPTDRGDSDCHHFIDDYACQWFEALDTYLSMTGEISFAREMLPHLVAQLKWFEQQKGDKDLYLLREYTSFDNPLAYITCEGATINGYLYQALHFGEKVTSRLGEHSLSAHYLKLKNELFDTYNRELWNDAEGAYASAYLDGSKLAPTIHAQLVALQSGLVPEERMESTRQFLLANFQNPGMKHCCTNEDYQEMIDNKSGMNMPITYYWLFNELYRMDEDKYDLLSLQEMRRRWYYMVTLQKDAGTLAESFVDHLGEGSDESCHNYGVIPAYYLSSYVLGVRTEKSVEEKEIVIQPHLGDLLFAEGDVVTEHGLVSVSWDRREESHPFKFAVKIPDGVKASLRLPIALAPLTINGVKGVDRGRWRVFDNLEGSI